MWNTDFSGTSCGTSGEHFFHFVVVFICSLQILLTSGSVSFLEDSVWCNFFCGSHPSLAAIYNSYLVVSHLLLSCNSLGKDYGPHPTEAFFGGWIQKCTDIHVKESLLGFQTWHFSFSLQASGISHLCGV